MDFVRFAAALIANRVRSSAENLRGGRDLTIGRTLISPMVALNNALDQRYVGSVAVNATGAKFFEPAPGRTLLAGARVMLGR